MLYGLHQAPRACNFKLDGILKKLRLLEKLQAKLSSTIGGKRDEVPLHGRSSCTYEESIKSWAKQAYWDEVPLNSFVSVSNKRKLYKWPSYLQTSSSYRCAGCWPLKIDLIRVMNIIWPLGIFIPGRENVQVRIRPTIWYLCLHYDC